MEEDERDEHTHEGSFASGQEREAHHPEREGRGRFGASAEEEEHAHEGDFATGESASDRHPEREGRGDFAEGQERE